MRAANLLLALQEVLHVAGKPVSCAHKGLDGCQAHGDGPLVVGDAPAVEPAVTLRRLEGRSRPLLQRLRRLHVVVVVEEDGAVRAALEVGEDDGVARLRRGRRGDGGPKLGQHIADKLGALVYAKALRADAGLAAEAQQSLYSGVCGGPDVLFNSVVHVIHPCSDA